MNLAPIAAAPPAIKVHLATVLPAFVIGTWQIFLSRKGSRYHRLWGSIYLALMTVTAVSTFFIRSITPGYLSPIHLFIPLTLLGVIGALWYARRGNISGHRTRCSASISAPW